MVATALSALRPRYETTFSILPGVVRRAGRDRAGALGGRGAVARARESAVALRCFLLLPTTRRCSYHHRHLHHPPPFLPPSAPRVHHFIARALQSSRKREAAPIVRSRLLSLLAPPSVAFAKMASKLDRSLDEILAERPRSARRGGKRGSAAPAGGIRKPSQRGAAQKANASIAQASVRAVKVPTGPSNKVNSTKILVSNLV